MAEYETEDRQEALYRRMGDPSWLVLRALQALGEGNRAAILRKVGELLAAAGAAHRRLDPSTLHYALKRMLEDGVVAEVGPEPPAHALGEPVAVYTTRPGSVRYRLTPIGAGLLELRQRRISVEVLMHTKPITQRPRPTIFAIAASAEPDLSERAGEERPKPREWRS